jgi:hypothetical protein
MKQRATCIGARDQGRCDNHLTIRRDDVEARVLSEIELKGNLAAMLGAATNAKRSPERATSRCTL